MKTCFKCGEEKPRSEFYAHPRMRDGLLGKCKQCTIADNEARRKKMEKNAKWRISELKRHRDKSAKYRALGIGPQKDLHHSARWIKSNPEKRKAHSVVRCAMKSGNLSRKPCAVCGRLDSQAHHDDYSKPLDVRWLCPKHHGEHHHNDRCQKILDAKSGLL